MGSDDAHDRAARLASHGEPSRQHVDVVAGLMPEAELCFIRRSLAARDALVCAVRTRLIVRMYQAFPRGETWFDLLGSVTEHLGPARRVDDRVGFQVPIPHAFERPGDCEREALLVLSKGAFRLFPSSNVPYHELDRAITLVAQKRASDTDVA